MRMRTKVSIVTVVGAGALLLCALAIIFTLRTQTAYAQDPASVAISLGEFTLPQGGSTYLVGTFRNLPNDPKILGNFHPNLNYRFDLQRNSEGTWIEANDCESDHFNRNIGISVYWREKLDVPVGAGNGFAIGFGLSSGLL